ncbi:hypothetical protein EVAR_67406_1 [Eumeta japonica]|uniref:Uncharacterized protein n=1 Tax=Eumeta variegata TaxID=151549 RepID=A0A4C1S9V3_EUMVA|nr:hypothetical protein EVAR_67406_1 [Eumeta japonica]
MLVETIEISQETYTSHINSKNSSHERFTQENTDASQSAYARLAPPPPPAPASRSANSVYELPCASIPDGVMPRAPAAWRSFFSPDDRASVEVALTIYSLITSFVWRIPLQKASTIKFVRRRVCVVKSQILVVLYLKGHVCALYEPTRA